MPSPPFALAGAWTKISDDRSAEHYPDQLEFGSGGLYFGRRTTGGSTRWDAGTWLLTAQGMVRMSTAKDPEVSYQVTVTGDVITFRDPQGRTARYRREIGC